ncbi:GntR family transcriptional regulator [Grimontia hollisae]|uniref:Transcriptional regulator GntR family n=2 Tax=Grimontia hollisae TaxID=673 RepID=D0I8T1_GRIHO|nr:GntR family transcriptional regulator [Grimontia hollisae]EEY71846.1 transcriptional regulator GntR family [Grimontia hollisae CIP 101886]STO77214.1 transcriptional regulator NanR [Grimontia hollisae]STO98354.1 transcriptional regulator NanR [Grimontia hollisae]STQ75823.1 transcriptional regulator NanR [Grimontia hollisae]
MKTNSQPLKTPRYVLIKETIRNAIESKQIAAGQILLEFPLSKLFHTSRVPVRQALELLHTEGLIKKLDGRGYLVTNGKDNPPAIRKQLNESNLGLDHNVDLFDNRTPSEKIFSAVESAITDCIAFGHFRIVETDLIKYFGVSSTVSRQVLLKLKDMGLVEKADNSHWVSGPLTSQSVTEYYDLRILLEPAALRRSIPHLRKSELLEMRSKLVALLTGSSQPLISDIESIERDLHSKCLSHSGNSKLIKIVNQSQIPLVVNHNFYKFFGTSNCKKSISEHLDILNHLINNDIEAAAESLEVHLKSAKLRTSQRLKSLAVCPEPNLPPYIKRIV